MKSRSNRMAGMSLFVVGAAALIGCIPEKRIVWSPDGSRAAVVAADGLRFCTSDGTLSPVRLPNAAAVAWFPDGRRIACLHGIEAKSWAEIEPILSKSEREATLVAAQQLHDQAMKHDGPWEQFKPRYTPPVSGGIQEGALMYVRDHMGDDVRRHVGDKMWKDLASLTVSVWTMQVFDVDGDSVRAGPTLLKSLDQLRAPHVAPNGRLVSVLRGDRPDKDVNLSLIALSADGRGAPLHVASRVSIEHDWSPDSRSIAFIYCPISPGDEDRTVLLGAVATAEVADASGALLTGDPRCEDRAGVLFNQFSAVRWLADGRIVFSSYELTLPATPRDMPQRAGLFALDPRMSATVVRLLARDFDAEFSENAPLFEVNPDGRRVLLYGNAGRVTMQDLATGESTELVKDPDPKGQTRLLAVWKGRDEVCYAVPLGAEGGSEHRAAIVVRSGKTQRVISRDWPADVVDGWLTEPGRPAATTQPSTP